MANWQRTLDLTDIWNDVEEGQRLADMAKEVAVRLRALPPIEGRHLLTALRDSIAAHFDRVAGLGEAALFDDFNDAMASLYDWGDVSLDQEFGGKKVCWIATNF